MNILSNIQSNLSRKARRFMDSQEGFTLIELLVVVIIMGVLAAVIVPNVARFAGRGQAEARNTEMKDIQTSMDALITDRRLATVNPRVGPALGVVDFSAAGLVDLDPDAVATAYLFPEWNRTNPSTLGAYCWNAAGFVTRVADATVVCP